MREDWVRSNTVASATDVDVDTHPRSQVEDVLGTYKAESLVGDMV